MAPTGPRGERARDATSVGVVRRVRFVRAGVGSEGESRLESDTRRFVNSPVNTVARKIVTIVFADLIGSTALHERLDAESVRMPESIPSFVATTTSALPSRSASAAPASRSVLSCATAHTLRRLRR
jgi:hypothetical protein